MRRFLGIALPLLVLLVVLYVIGSAGGAGRDKSTAPRLLPPARQAVSTTGQASGALTIHQATSTVPNGAQRTTTVVTAGRTDCRWRRYHDGAIGTDPSCAPGELDTTVTGPTTQTVCSRAWVTAATQLQPPPSTLEKLLIEYQLPGNAATYALARVVPVEDGGSPTSPQNLYPLPVSGFGGLETQTIVAAQLRDEICSRKMTVAEAAKTLEGDWLSKGLPNHD
jgi:hypothetical protein